MHAHPFQEEMGSTSGHACASESTQSGYTVLVSQTERKQTGGGHTPQPPPPPPPTLPSFLPRGTVQPGEGVLISLSVQLVNNSYTEEPGNLGFRDALVAVPVTTQ